MMRGRNSGEIVGRCVPLGVTLRTRLFYKQCMCFVLVHALRNLWYFIAFYPEKLWAGCPQPAALREYLREVES